MSDWAALDRFLQTDPRDVGCERAMELLHIYVENSEPRSIKLDAESGTIPNGRANGHLARDAEEFELHGLASDDEDDQNEEERLLKEQNGTLS